MALVQSNKKTLEQMENSREKLDKDQVKDRSETSNNRSISTSSSTMDELSIDSTTNEKIDNKCNSPTWDEKKKAHFKIEWRQLTYYQRQTSLLSRLGGASKRKPRRILNSLDGCFKSGELSAILGPSGAGKSTFISALFGSKQDAAFGQTRVSWLGEEQQSTVREGESKPSSSRTTKRRPIRIAAIPQHDHLLNHLTVYETLMFASRIKNADKLHQQEGKNFHRLNVRRVAKMLKLNECLDTRCNKLSGGQHKRVSIGQELLSEPDVIILDEPTSGLDAMTCLSTIQTLKSIVKKHPMSIILTIHQPDTDVFNLFDHVYVIAQGGIAIYEGAPKGIMSTLASVGIRPPSENYNPARFIVETAFLGEPTQETQDFSATMTLNGEDLDIKKQPLTPIKETQDSVSSSDDDEDEEEEEENHNELNSNYLKRSMLSLSEVISGKEMPSRMDRKRDKKPLLNIAIKTADGDLITSEQLQLLKNQTDRLDLLKRLNQIQKAPYSQQHLNLADQVIPVNEKGLLVGKQLGEQHSPDSCYISCEVNNARATCASSPGNSSSTSYIRDEQISSAKSDYSSFNGHQVESDQEVTRSSERFNSSKRTLSLAQLELSLNPSGGDDDDDDKRKLGRSLQMLNSSNLNAINLASFDDHTDEYSESNNISPDEVECTKILDGSNVRLKRQFDKRLSAKHNCSHRRGNPIWHHAFLLAHRTWLSIVRDPIFFGIQACMHTIIPILLASIFGSVQEEGCPQVGNFDLVEFAYSQSEQSMIQGTVSSIRKSIGNIGIIFFEMFVLSFSINCITALVFPQDMYVLLKEYRNGWYSMRSYFFGRTMADLPVPILLHSLAMAILYFLTGQPHSLWRFSSIIALVILASLVAQSVGLTIGALLMRSSQSAVLAAAGIVAPFFALSGFIVRIHTLPYIAQLAAKCSYLYHLLNGFIILRYGFGRCQCDADDFQANDSHQIPGQLHTMASMWIGTYSNEFPNQVLGENKNRTNVDPNIDVVDKMMNAFRMANSYGHQITTCDDVLPYAMLDFNLRDYDIYSCFIVMIVMLIISRFITFTAIYYKIRSFA